MELVSGWRVGGWCKIKGYRYHFHHFLLLLFVELGTEGVQNKGVSLHDVNTEYMRNLQTFHKPIFHRHV
jgi:hypothetical protein